VTILPLYSQLNPEKQYRIFNSPKEGHRLIVISTNVAETSLTIPNIRYVVDSGRAKEKVYDKKLSLSRFQVEWISKASAEQRAGRAGRTGPGHCYRLYSSALFSKIKDFSEPEILKTPLDQTLLQLKSIGVEDLLRFPYVTKPPVSSIHASIKKLTILGALKLNPALMPPNLSMFAFTVNQQRKNIDEILENSLVDQLTHSSRDPTEITELGTLLSKIPIDPKCGKILVMASKYDLMHYGIMIVACMSV
jgi:ATP-dependent RNA helicase DHX37/DHR1